MEQTIIILLSVLSLTIRVDAQFYDLFQNFQPYSQTTAKPNYDFFSDFGFNPKSDVSRRNEDTRQKPPITVISEDRTRTTSKPKRKLTQTQNFNLDLTTAKPIRKTTKNSSHRNINSNKPSNPPTSNRRQFYDETANNVDYNERTTRRSITSKRPSTTAKAYYNANYNTYTQRPGVKPAPVDTNKPPITNRPPTPRPLAVYPIVTDSSAIRFPEDPDTSPEIFIGPDADRMSTAEKRRYISLAEKMCDKYKSFNVQKVEAIPLLPSPEPVQVNVSVCTPTTIPLVVGGKVVSIKEFPHMALLGWTKIQRGGYSWKCGGSLISDQYVLTAGHCSSQEKDDTVVTGAPRVVQLGSSYMDDTGALVVKILNVIRHPKYARPKSYYDIALVKLVRPVTFSQVIKPACLGEPPGVGEPVVVTGWGRTEFGVSLSLELRSVSVPIWDMDECREVLGVSRKMPNGPSRESQLCAGEKRGGKDTCQGDSGGPAQIQDGCVWRVVAVTSIGRSCGAPNTPAVYATVDKAFIAAQIFGKSQNNQQNSATNTNSRPNSQTNINNNNRQDSIVNNQATWNSNSQTNRNNNRQGSIVNNNQGTWNSNSQSNKNNNRQNSGENRNNNQGSFTNNNNNQNTWNTNNNNQNSRNENQQNSNNNANRNNNQNSWNQQNNNNNGNWNGEYQSSNVNRNNNRPQNNNNNVNYQFGSNPNYDTGNYNARPESGADYGGNREYNYNDNNRGDYDDYYESNREQRNNFRSNYATTKRPSYSWPNFGF